MTRVQSFPPIVGPQTRALVLGSMPGVESLRQQRYYAHPRNLFWPIVAELFGFDAGLDYDERVQALVAHGVGLWDVLGHCVRPGSLDADIRDEVPNDLVGLLTERPAIRMLAFNGKKAHAAFQKHIAPLLGDRLLDLQLEALPSTSPAHAAMRREEKQRRWSVVQAAVRPQAP